MQLNFAKRLKMKSAGTVQDEYCKRSQALFAYGAVLGLADSLDPRAKETRCLSECVVECPGLY